MGLETALFDSAGVGDVGSVGRGKTVVIHVAGETLGRGVVDAVPELPDAEKVAAVVESGGGGEEGEKVEKVHGDGCRGMGMGRDIFTCQIWTERFSVRRPRQKLYLEAD